MYITTLTFDAWNGVYDEGGEVDAPQWEDIETYIQALDGSKHTLVVLQGADEAHMAIGGEQSHYIVYATFDNQRFEQLQAQQVSDTSNSLVHLTVGGQPGDYQVRHIVTQGEAMKAAKTFALSGSLNEDLVWSQ